MQNSYIGRIVKNGLKEKARNFFFSAMYIISKKKFKSYVDVLEILFNNCSPAINIGYLRKRRRIITIPRPMFYSQSVAKVAQQLITTVRDNRKSNFISDFVREILNILNKRSAVYSKKFAFYKKALANRFNMRIQRRKIKRRIFRYKVVLDENRANKFKKKNRFKNKPRFKAGDVRSVRRYYPLPSRIRYYYRFCRRSKYFLGLSYVDNNRSLVSFINQIKNENIGLFSSNHNIFGIFTAPKQFTITGVGSVKSKLLRDPFFFNKVFFKSFKFLNLYRNMDRMVFYKRIHKIFWFGKFTQSDRFFNRQKFYFRRKKYNNNVFVKYFLYIFYKCNLIKKFLKIILKIFSSVCNSQPVEIIWVELQIIKKDQKCIKKNFCL